MLNDPLTIETAYTVDHKIVTPISSVKITTSDKWIKLWLPTNKTTIENRRVLHYFFYKLYDEFNSKAALKVTYSL